MKQKTIYAADLFCGAGGTSSGFLEACKELGMKVELVAVNHWETAIATHTLNHPGVIHYDCDLEKLDPLDAVKGGYLDVLLASPECFPAGALVLTDKGLIEIQDIKAGDLVQTHTGKFQKVSGVMKSRKETVVVKGIGHYGLETTANHPFLALRRGKKWMSETRSYDYDMWSQPEWTQAGSLNGSYWASPTEIAFVRSPEFPAYPGKNFFWMLGRWVGDGSIDVRPGRGGGVTICCGNHEADELEDFFDQLKDETGFLFKRRQARTATLFDCRSKVLADWLYANFGKLAHGKSLPTWLYSTATFQQEAFLEGYCSADGHVEGTQMQVSTVSRKLAIGIKLLVTGLGFSTTLNEGVIRNNPIEGRVVNIRKPYFVRWHRTKEHRARYDLYGYAWSVVKSVENGEVKDVYNLSVEEDESYIVDGIIVHNCTHFSNARGAKPMSEQSRASANYITLWCEKLDIRELVIENVREFMTWGPLHRCTCATKTLSHSSKCQKDRPNEKRKGEYFRKFIRDLEKLGYTVQYRVLNCADYGDATTRKRLFIRASKNGKPTFPEQTHTKNPDLFVQKRWRAVREVLDLSNLGKSIFNRKKPLSPNTLRRIETGMQRYGGVPVVIGQQSGAEARPINEPSPTVAGAGAIGLAQAYIIPQFSDAPPLPIDKPLGVITTQSRGIGLAQPFLIPCFGDAPGQSRTHSIDAPLPTQTGSNTFALAQPFIVSTDNTKANGAQVRSADEPLQTITTRPAFGVAQPFITQADMGGSLRSVDEPMGTITSADTRAIVQAFLIEYYGTGESFSVESPLKTQTGKDRFGLVQPRFEYNGKEYVLEIYYRMLTPRELAGAMSFHPDYQFTGTREEVVKQIGNAVPGETAKALSREAILAAMAI